MASFSAMDAGAPPRVPAAPDARRISNMSVDDLDLEAEQSPEVELARRNLPPVEAENVLLRQRIKRRNMLLGLIRDAYLRDIVVIKEQLFEAERRKNNYQPNHTELCRLPSLDMRHAISLFAPSECYLNVSGCETCGGQLEIIHVEYTALKDLQKAYAERTEELEQARHRIVDLEFEVKAVRESEMLAKVRGAEEKRAMLEMIAQLKGEREERENVLIDSLNEKIRGLQAQLESTSDLFKQLEAMQFDYLEARDTAKSQTGEITGLKKQIKVKEVKIKRMGMQIVKEKQINQKLVQEKEEVLTMGQQLEERLKSQLNEMNSALELQTSHNDGMEDTLGRLREEADASAHAMEEMKLEFSNTLEEEAAARERVTEELATFKSAAANTQRQLEEMKNKLRNEMQKQAAVQEARERDIANALKKAEDDRARRRAALGAGGGDSEDDFDDGSGGDDDVLLVDRRAQLQAEVEADIFSDDDDADAGGGGVLLGGAKSSSASSSGGGRGRSTPKNLRVKTQSPTRASGAHDRERDIAAAVAEGKAAAAAAAAASEPGSAKHGRGGGLSLGGLMGASKAAAKMKANALVMGSADTPFTPRDRSGAAPTNLMEELQQLEAENHQLRAKHQKITTVYLKAKERIQALKHDMVLSDDSIDTLTRQIGELQTEIAQNHKDMTFKDDRIQGLNERLEVLEQDLFRLRRKIRNVNSTEDEMSTQLEGETAQREASERLVSLFRLRFERMRTLNMEINGFLAANIRALEMAHLHPSAEPAGGSAPTDPAQYTAWAERLDGMMNINLEELSFKEHNQRLVKEEECARRGQTMAEFEREEKNRKKRMQKKTVGATEEEWSSSDDEGESVLVSQEGLSHYLRYRLDMARVEASLDLRLTVNERDRTQQLLLEEKSERAKLAHALEQSGDKVKSLEERIIAAAGETKGSKERAMMSITRIEQLEYVNKEKDKSIEALQNQAQNLVAEKNRLQAAAATLQIERDEAQTELDSRVERDRVAIESLERAAAKELLADDLVARHLEEVKEAERAVEAEKENTAAAERRIVQIHEDIKAEIASRVSSYQQTDEVITFEQGCQAEWDPPSMSLRRQNDLSSFPHGYGVGGGGIVVCRPKGQLQSTLPHGEPVITLASSVALGTTPDSVVPDVISTVLRSPESRLSRPASGSLYTSLAAADMAYNAIDYALASPSERSSRPSSSGSSRPASGLRRPRSAALSPPRGRPQSALPTSTPIRSGSARRQNQNQSQPRPQSSSPARPQSAYLFNSSNRGGGDGSLMERTPKFETTVPESSTSRPPSANLTMRPSSSLRRPPGLDPIRKQQLDQLTKKKPPKMAVPPVAPRIRFYQKQVQAGSINRSPEKQGSLPVFQPIGRFF